MLKLEGKVNVILTFFLSIDKDQCMFWHFFFPAVENHHSTPWKITGHMPPGEEIFSKSQVLKDHKYNC